MKLYTTEVPFEDVVRQPSFNIKALNDRAEAASQTLVNTAEEIVSHYYGDCYPKQAQQREASLRELSTSQNPRDILKFAASNADYSPIDERLVRAYELTYKETVEMFSDLYEAFLAGWINEDQFNRAINSILIELGVRKAQIEDKVEETPEPPKVAGATPSTEEEGKVEVSEGEGPQYFFEYVAKTGLNHRTLKYVIRALEKLAKQTIIDKNVENAIEILNNTDPEAISNFLLGLATGKFSEGMVNSGLQAEFTQEQTEERYAVNEGYIEAVYREILRLKEESGSLDINLLHTAIRRWAKLDLEQKNTGNILQQITTIINRLRNLDDEVLLELLTKAQFSVDGGKITTAFVDKRTLSHNGHNGGAKTLEVVTLKTEVAERGNIVIGTTGEVRGIRVGDITFLIEETPWNTATDKKLAIQSVRAALQTWGQRIELTPENGFALVDKKQLSGARLRTIKYLQRFLEHCGFREEDIVITAVNRQPTVIQIEGSERLTLISPESKSISPVKEGEEELSSPITKSQRKSRKAPEIKKEENPIVTKVSLREILEEVRGKLNLDEDDPNRRTLKDIVQETVDSAFKYLKTNGLTEEEVGVIIATAIDTALTTSGAKYRRVGNCDYPVVVHNEDLRAALGNFTGDKGTTVLHIYGKRNQGNTEVIVDDCFVQKWLEYMQTQRKAKGGVRRIIRISSYAGKKLRDPD